MTRYNTWLPTLVESWKILRSRSATVLFLISVGLLALAYQFFQPYRLSIGSAGDEVFESGFYFQEGTADAPLRWTNGNATVSLFGIGNQPLRLSIRLSGIRPTESAQAQIWVNGNRVSDFSPSAEMTDYQFLLDRQVVGWTGNLSIQILSDTFTPGADPRQLGLMVEWIQLEPPSNFNFTIPPPLFLGYFVFLILVSFVILSRWQPFKRWAFAISLTLAALLGLGTIFYRVPIAGYTPWIAPLAVIGYLLARGMSKLKAWELLAIALLVISLGRFAQSASALWTMGPQADFQIYFDAAQRLHNGELFYDLNLIRANPIGQYIYPPLLAMLLSPLTPLGLRAASDIWFVINLGLFAFLLMLLAKLSALKLRSPPVYLLLIAALNFQPVIETLLRGQPDLVILLLLVLALFAPRGRGEVVSGILVAFAAALKIYPGLALISMLVKRQWRAVAAFAIAGLLLLALFTAVVGGEQMLQYISWVLSGQTPAVPSPENQSFNGFVSRLFIPGPGLQIGWTFPFPDWAKGLLIALDGITLLVTGAIIWHHRSNPVVDNRLGFAALIPVMLMVWPTSWIHYETLLLLPLALVLFDLKHHPKNGALIALLLLGAYLLLAFGDEDTISGAAFCCGVASLARSFKLYGIALLWLLSLATGLRQNEPVG